LCYRLLSPTIGVGVKYLAMELSQYVDEPMLAALRRLLPNATLQPVLRPLSWSAYPSVSVALPVPAGAEYGFKLYFQPERQISARLLVADGTYYFWYMPFEDAAFRNSVEELDAAFVQTIEHLVWHETRIVQKRGLINHSFRCDYKSASGWKRVFSHSALRLGGFHPPLIAGRERVYTSPAIVLR
jgi:hypothetical protein